MGAEASAKSSLALALANELLAQERFREAEIAFRLALAERPKSAALHAGLAQALAGRGEPEAERHMRRAVRLDPGRAEYQNALGCLTDDPVAAAEAFTAAVALAPDEVMYRNNLALCLLAQGKRNEAMSALRRSLALDIVNPRAALMLGDALLDDGRLEDALSVYSGALQVAKIPCPHPRGAWNAYFEGRYDEADALFRGCEQTDDNEAYAWIHYGMTRGYIASARHDTALRSIRVAIRLLPEEGLFHEVLAACLGAQRLTMRAAAAESRAAMLKPSGGRRRARLSTRPGP